MVFSNVNSYAQIDDSNRDETQLRVTTLNAAEGSLRQYLYLTLPFSKDILKEKNRIRKVLKKMIKNNPDEYEDLDLEELKKIYNLFSDSYEWSKFWENLFFEGVLKLSLDYDKSIILDINLNNLDDFFEDCYDIILPLKREDAPTNYSFKLNLENPKEFSRVFKETLNILLEPLVPVNTISFKQNEIEI